MIGPFRVALHKRMFGAQTRELIESSPKYNSDKLSRNILVRAHLRATRVRAQECGDDAPVPSGERGASL